MIKKPTRSNIDDKKAQLSGQISNHDSFMVEHLKYIYELNQALITSIQSLEEKYKILAGKNDELRLENQELLLKYDNLHKPPNAVNIQQPNDETAPGAFNDNKSEDVKVIPNDMITVLQNKIDSIEQKNLNSTFLLNGNSALEMINSSNSVLDDLRILVKDKLRSMLPAEEKSQVDGIDSVAIFGRNKNIIRITTNSNKIRNNLLKTVKITKPSELYASECLTKLRYKLYMTSRFLAKNNPEIEWVRTHNGNILYKRKSDPKINTISNEFDPRNLEKKNLKCIFGCHHACIIEINLNIYNG